MAILSIVGTPIGNLEDITERALRTLREAAYILCEDTRVTRKLLDHYGIKTSTLSYHQHTGVLKTDKIMTLLEEGLNLALVTDAGTPGISDPGSRLVSAVRERFGNAVSIVSIPGVSALTAAVSLAGEGYDRFLFLGFLPHKKGRQTMLKQIIAADYPSIVYESKHRIIKLLEELVIWEEKESVIFSVQVARELTKLHESFYEGRPTELASRLQADPNNLKGEFVALIKTNHK